MTISLYATDVEKKSEFGGEFHLGNVLLDSVLVYLFLDAFFSLNWKFSNHTGWPQ